MTEQTATKPQELQEVRLPVDSRTKKIIFDYFQILNDVEHIFRVFILAHEIVKPESVNLLLATAHKTRDNFFGSRYDLDLDQIYIVSGVIFVPFTFRGKYWGSDFPDKFGKIVATSGIARFRLDGNKLVEISGVVN